MRGFTRRTSVAAVAKRTVRRDARWSFDGPRTVASRCAAANVKGASASRPVGRRCRRLSALRSGRPVTGKRVPRGACSRADASGRPERSEPVPRPGAGAMRWCRGRRAGARRPIVTARRDVRPRAGSGLPGCTRPLASGDPCSGRRARQVHVSARAAPGRVEFLAGVRWAVGQASEGACVRALGPPLPSGFGRLPRALRRPAAGTGRARADRRCRRHGPPLRAAATSRRRRTRPPRAPGRTGRLPVNGSGAKSTFEFQFAARPFSKVVKRNEDS